MYFQWHNILKLNRRSNDQLNQRKKNSGSSEKTIVTMKDTQVERRQTGSSLILTGFTPIKQWQLFVFPNRSTVMNKTQGLLAFAVLLLLCACGRSDQKKSA